MRILLFISLFLAACSVVSNDFYESSVELTIGRSLPFCTAGHIGDGLFLTAGHCARKNVSLFIEGEPIEPVFVDHKYDIAIFRAKTLANTIKSNPLRCVTPRIGQKVIVVGEPQGSDDIHTFGHIAGNKRKKSLWEEVVPMNVVGVPGSSGSPVYSTSNDIIGVLVGASQPYGSFTMMVPGSTICKVWKDHP